MALILVADDVTLSREALARTLRDRGHRVIQSMDGADAVDRFSRERPELCVLDVNMPRLSGPDACARIKSLPGPFTPVLLMSVRTDLETRVACLAVAEDFVAKPYEAAELSARIDAHLRTRRLVEELRSRADSVVAPAPAFVAAAGSVAASTAAATVDNRASATGSFCDRAAFLERLTDEWRQSTKTNEPLALLIAGADGDGSRPMLEPTHWVAAAMQRTLRGVDILCRFDDQHVGGLLKNTHLTGALAASDRFRRELRHVAGQATAPSVSMGIALFPGRDISDAADLLRHAERALARARDEGAGLVCLHQHQSYLFQPVD